MYLVTIEQAAFEFIRQHADGLISVTIEKL